MNILCFSFITTKILREFRYVNIESDTKEFPLKEKKYERDRKQKEKLYGK